MANQTALNLSFTRLAFVRMELEVMRVFALVVARAILEVEVFIFFALQFCRAVAITGGNVPNFSDACAVTL